MRTVAVIDYGMSNIDSVVRALTECGGKPFVASKPSTLTQADSIVLPGVGAFADGMRELHKRGFDDAIRTEAIENRIPVLGVCLGMQMLASHGDEGGDTPGLGLIDGRVTRLSGPGGSERIPHVGWNGVIPQQDCPLMRGIQPGSDFYFVHSYHLQCAHDGNAVARTDYCGGFTSVVRRDYIFGVQFHPEKSQKLGLMLLRNFLSV